ncbi:MAG: metalloregulator ArsR/SmtB family transcription factor [Brooklawnia sp.]|uniref:helix-turn-helix transcriptional regulator n=1 Tax=Brooklawnia sp. TaxID=2699740 RepID=UPI003C707648
MSRFVPESPVRAQATAPDPSTRQRVLDLLLARGTMTASELAGALGLTTAGVRRHLAALVESGDITAREQAGPRGRGRPAQVFSLTPTGRRVFGQAYDDLALSALRELVDAAGPDAIDRLAEKRLADIEADYLRRRAVAPDADPTQLLADALNAAGYFASTQDDGALCQHHCPVAHVAVHFPQLCEAEASVFARLLGTDVSRSATIASGDEACRTHLGGRTLLPNPTTQSANQTSADRKVSA